METASSPICRASKPGLALTAGGKGTPRRKVVKKSVTATQGDDRKIQAALKKLGVQPITGVEEVNMFKEDGNVLHFNNPRGELRVSVRGHEERMRGNLGHGLWDSVRSSCRRAASRIHALSPRGRHRGPCWCPQSPCPSRFPLFNSSPLRLQLRVLVFANAQSKEPSHPTPSLSQATAKPKSSPNSSPES